MESNTNYKDRYIELRSKYNDIVKDLKSVTSLWSKETFEDNVLTSDQVEQVTLETYSSSGWEHYNTIRLSQLEATTYYELENRLTSLWDRKGVEARITIEFESYYKGFYDNNYFELSFDGIEFTFDYHITRGDHKK